METFKINPEKLAYWYFRVNGCFTFTNFIIHPDQGRGQRTDVDIMAVRLPYRSELLENPMRDDDVLLPEGNRIRVILAEVKMGTCNLNGPWTERERANMQRAVKAAGPFPPDKVEEAAEALYRHGFYQDDRSTMTLFCVGKKENKEIKQKYPKVPQLTWPHILGFLYDRFTAYQEQKHSNSQWDCWGRGLYRTSVNSESKETFVSSIIIDVDNNRPQRRLNKKPKYAKLWRNIQDRLNFGPFDWKERINQFGQVRAIEERKNGRIWSDQDIFEGLVRAVLSNNTDWTKVESVLSDLHALFHDFSPQYYASLSANDIEALFVPWFVARKAGSMNMEKSLTNLIGTAKKLLEWSQKHGKVDLFFIFLIEQHDHDLKDVAKQFGSTKKGPYKLPAVGIPIAAEFMKNIGYDIAKPDRHITRAVGSFGLVKFGNWKDRKERKPPQANESEMLETMIAMENFAKSVDKLVTFVDNAVWLVSSKSGLYFTNEELSALVL